MNDNLKTLIESIKKAPPGQPEFKIVANHIDSINPDVKEWKKLAPILISHYGYKNNQELVDALKIGAGEEVHFDDFQPIIDKYKIGGWIGDYVEHTKGIEPPTAFHFATALTILGAALQRDIHVPRGYFKIYPAVHTLLSGPSATMKTTAADYGYRLLTESGRAFGVLGESKQYIHNKLFGIQEQTNNATGILYSPEIADFIGDDEWKKSLISYLIRLFDSENNIESGTLARGEKHLENVAVSFLGCSNEELLDQAVPKIALGSGFMSRLLIFHCEGTNRVKDDPQIPKDASSWDWLKERLMLTQFIKGEMLLDEEATIWYKFWYNVKWRAHFPKDDRLVPFHKRIRNYILLLAMLFSISDEIGGECEVTPIIGNTRYIKEIHLEQAEAVLGWIYSKIPKLYELLGNSAFGKEQIRIMNILKRHKSMDYRELSRKLRFPHKKLREHVDTLKRNGMIGEDSGTLFMKKDFRKGEKK